MALVPVVIEREGMGERSWDLFSRLLKDRIIMVQGPVEPGMANIIKAELLYLESEDPKADITMYIDSPGGEVTTGMGIVDTMDYIQCDVRTICCGLAASMGSVILMCGTPGKRMALPHAEVMIHQPSAGAQGKVSDMERSYEHSKWIKDMMHGLYVERTGLDLDIVVAALDRDTWLTPEEAIKFGIIDEVVNRREI